MPRGGRPLDTPGQCSAPHPSLAPPAGVASTEGAEDPAAGLDRLRRDQHEGDDAGLRAAVDPVVHGPALDHHVAGLQMRYRARLELHVDFARHDHRIVDGVGAVDAWNVARLELEDAEDGPVVEGRTGLAQPLIRLAG